MYKEGHTGASLAFYSPLGFVTFLVAGRELAFLGALVAVGLAMLPDVDTRIPFVKHRGSTHTIWFALGTGGVLGVFGATAGSTAGVVGAVGGGLFGLLLGTGTVLSHIWADALTPAGVRPFWPVRGDEYSYGVARASNPLANYGLLGLGSGVALLALLFARTIT